MVHLSVSGLRKDTMGVEGEMWCEGVSQFKGSCGSWGAVMGRSHRSEDPVCLSICEPVEYALRGGGGGGPRTDACRLRPGPNRPPLTSALVTLPPSHHTALLEDSMSFADRSLWLRCPGKEKSRSSPWSWGWGHSFSPGHLLLPGGHTQGLFYSIYAPGYISVTWDESLLTAGAWCHYQSPI